MNRLKAYYLFGKTHFPRNTGADINQEIDRLRRSASKDEYLRAAYDTITTRYASGRVGTYLKIHELFSKGANELWSRTGFMHCTNQNYLLALLLVKGGYCDESEIKLRWTTVNYLSPHQYLMVKNESGQWINVDCWGRHYGIRYGDYAHGFNTTLLKSFIKD